MEDTEHQEDSQNGLLPCPFCGGEAVWLIQCPPTIRCTRCSAEVIVAISSTSSHTKFVWNSRTKQN